MVLTSEQIEHGKQSLILHDFFTPSAIAFKIADQHLRPLFKTHKLAHQHNPNPPPFRLLEPAVGSGNLLWPAIDVAREEGVDLEITCFDLQLDYLEYVQHKLQTDYNIIITQSTQLTQPDFYYLAAEAAAFADRGLEWPPK